MEHRAELFCSPAERRPRGSQRSKFPVSPSLGGQTGHAGRCAGAESAVGERGSSAPSLKENLKKQGINRDIKTARSWEQERPPRAGEVGCRRAGRTRRT